LSELGWNDPALNARLFNVGAAPNNMLQYVSLVRVGVSVTDVCCVGGLRPKDSGDGLLSFEVPGTGLLINEYCYAVCYEISHSRTMARRER
jgi:hypothetical protein